MYASLKQCMRTIYICLLASFTPVEFLLDGGCQFLIKALKVGKTDHECVSLRPDQLLCVPQVLHFSITVMKPKEQHTQL